MHENKPFIPIEWLTPIACCAASLLVYFPFVYGEIKKWREIRQYRKEREILDRLESFLPKEDRIR